MDTATIIATAAALLAAISTIFQLLDRRDRGKNTVAEAITAARQSLEKKINESEQRLNEKIENIRRELTDGGQTFATFEERFKNIQRELDLARQSEKESIGRLINNLTKTLEEKSRRSNND